MMFENTCTHMLMETLSNNKKTKFKPVPRHSSPCWQKIIYSTQNMVFEYGTNKIWFQNYAPVPSYNKHKSHLLTKNNIRSSKYGSNKIWFRNYAPEQRHRSPLPTKEIIYSTQNTVSTNQYVKTKKYSALKTWPHLRYSMVFEYGTNKTWIQNYAPVPSNNKHRSHLLTKNNIRYSKYGVRIRF